MARLWIINKKEGTRVTHTASPLQAQGFHSDHSSSSVPQTRTALPAPTTPLRVNTTAFHQKNGKKPHRCNNKKEGVGGGIFTQYKEFDLSSTSRNQSLARQYKMGGLSPHNVGYRGRGGGEGEGGVTGVLPSYAEHKQSGTNRSTSGHMSMSRRGTLQHELAGKPPAHSCCPRGPPPAPDPHTHSRSPASGASAPVGKLWHMDTMIYGGPPSSPRTAPRVCASVGTLHVWGRLLIPSGGSI